MNQSAATASVKFTLPPLDLFRLPPSQPHKLVTRLPLPPADTVGARFFRPFLINPEIFRLSLDLKLVVTFAVVYTTTVLCWNRVNASRQYRPWAFSKTSSFKALVVAHNAFLALYSAWTLLGILDLMYSFSRSAVADDGQSYYAHLAELYCEVESSAFISRF